MAFFVVFGFSFSNFSFLLAAVSQNYCQMLKRFVRPAAFSRVWRRAFLVSVKFCMKVTAFVSKSCRFWIVLQGGKKFIIWDSSEVVRYSPLYLNPFIALSAVALLACDAENRPKFNLLRNDTVTMITRILLMVKIQNFHGVMRLMSTQY